jgi:hypothetical protein
MHDEPTTLGGDGKFPQINLYNTKPPSSNKRGLIHLTLHLISWICIIIAAYIVWRVAK